MVLPSEWLHDTIEAPLLLTTDLGGDGGTVSNFSINSGIPETAVLERIPSKPSSLDNIIQICPGLPSTAKKNSKIDIKLSESKPVFVSSWGPKEKRFFHRYVSGFRRRTRGERLRLMTLTTYREGLRHLLPAHFSALHKRIIRKYGRFDYIKVITSEGFGTIHVVYDGTYIPQRWLSVAWGDIHGSPIVDIRSVYRHNNNSLARYLVSHLVEQPYARMSWSWSWVYRGFVSRWYLLRKCYKDRAVMFWNKHLRGEEIHARDFILRTNGDITSVSSVSLA